MEPRVHHVPAPRPAPFVELPGTATVLTLGAHMCKWPIGDPRDESFSFCGQLAEDGPYCLRHRQVAYRPGSANGRGEDLVRLLRRYIG
jgi:GcrA cell cycle regulator